MEIKRHLPFRAGDHPELVHYLNMTFTKWKHGEIISTVDLLESDFRWTFVAAYIAEHGLSARAETIFSEAERSAAPWLRVRSNWRFGYPQPEAAFGYKTVTYTRAAHCAECGCGLEQIAPFRMKSAPKWGRRHFLSLNWVFDELFTDDTGKNALEDVSGLSFREVLNKKGALPHPGVHQLVIPYILPPGGLIPDEQTIRKEQRCPACGVTKYVTTGLGMLRFKAEIFKDAPDIVKTAEVFGDGKLCCRDILVRQRVYRLLSEGKLDSSLVFEPVELV